MRSSECSHGPGSPLRTPGSQLLCAQSGRLELPCKNYDLFLTDRGLLLFCLVKTPEAEEVPTYLSLRGACRTVRCIRLQEHGMPTCNHRSINVALQILPGAAFGCHRLVLMVTRPKLDGRQGRAIWTLTSTFAQAPSVSPIPIDVWGTSFPGRQHSLLIPRSFSSLFL